MNDMKEYIANVIKNAISDDSISLEDIISKIEVPKDNKNGDLAYPCFNLSKVLKKSPVAIAEELKEKIGAVDKISKIDVVNGYLNFYFDNDNMVKEVLVDIINKKENYGNSDEGKSKNIIADYSSPNIAKPFHLGHFRTTVIGRAICNLYSALGYNVVRINHLGDWGTQFGLLIEGYKLYKDEYEIEKDPLHILSEIYVRINKLAKEDEKVKERARENFKRLEEGDKELLELWEYFRDISLKEYLRIYDYMGCKFDSYNGEAFYNDKMDEVVKMLDEKGVLEESQGAKVVKLGEDEPPCIIVKSDGSTIYATRDLAAILYRVRTYDFYRAIYVTSYEQIAHFRQVFEVAKNIVDKKYVDGLVHVPYGMVRLKTGKMSTREGTVIYLQDLISDSVNKALQIIETKNPELENKEEIAKKVGLGALVFNDLKHSKIKDIVFDLDEILRFDGETGPYIQYTYVRINSILNKSGFDLNSVDVSKLDFSKLNSKEEIELVKEISNFSQTIKRAAEEYEPSILARYLVNVATLYSRFYNECPILNQEEDIKNIRILLCFATSIIIKKGLEILGIECPDKM